MLPGFDGCYDRQAVTLTYNDSGRFEDRWVWLKANKASPCIFTRDLDIVYYPVRHGEGKFVARDADTLKALLAANLSVFTYIDPQSNTPTIKYPENPNGSQSAIAGICDPSGRVFGLMPHPEAYLFKTNHPRWTRDTVPEEGMGVPIFRNAYRYVKERL